MTCWNRNASAGDAGARGPQVLSWSLARDFLATGAHILWRASASFTLRPVKVLADGTYLAELKKRR